MWEIVTLENTQNNFKFFLKESDKRISNHRFLNLLKESGVFREYYNETLSGCDFEAFFWENKPFTQQNMGDTYECNLVKSDFLATCSPDAQTFNSYFKENKSVVCFHNLGKDAQLIAPCPLKKKSAYTHIGNFVRNAEEDQVHKFWETIGIETLKSIEKQPIWLSTSGLGVYWLHARIDTYPKYYQTKEYKTVSS